ncbi:hypothetical protein CEXT_444291 [Caerostris extrusa]|uniref:Uncharacterized protein n=1 Tax=Caerostris extrusa TaxID=172846 RepID=A0AAV4Y4I1_CAEEX|nr:hypothetical protein CEXT_444291 [Caerostris extrusa]
MGSSSALGSRIRKLPQTCHHEKETGEPRKSDSKSKEVSFHVPSSCKSANQMGSGYQNWHPTTVLGILISHPDLLPRSIQIRWFRREEVPSDDDA